LRERKITQQEFGVAMKLSPLAVRKLLTGRLPMDERLIERLAGILDKRPSYFRDLERQWAAFRESITGKEQR
jgi:transcriptional regulator with XRE-family HTH domain